MGNPIRFVYCTKEEFLRQVEEQKLKDAQVEESSTTSQEDVGSSDPK